MNIPKVIFFTYSLSTGGAERRLATLANAFADKGAQVKIVLLDMPKVDFPVNPKVEVVFLEQETQSWELETNQAEVNFVTCQQPPPITIWQKLCLKLHQKFAKHKYAIEESRQYLYNRYAHKIKSYLLDFPDWIVISFMSFCSVATLMATEKLPNNVIIAECTSPEADSAA